jgi:hypothetical protein
MGFLALVKVKDQGQSPFLRRHAIGPKASAHAGRNPIHVGKNRRAQTFSLICEFL